MMKTLEELVKDNAPRLVVLFRRQEDGSEQFQWGMAGKVPLLTLIGSVINAQTSLATMDRQAFEDCDQQAFLIVFDPDSTDVIYFCHADMPVLPLVGMLETIKSALVNSRMGQHVASQQTQLLGPDGNPMRM